MPNYESCSDIVGNMISRLKTRVNKTAGNNQGNQVDRKDNKTFKMKVEPNKQKTLKTARNKKTSPCRKGPSTDGNTQFDEIHGQSQGLSWIAASYKEKVYQNLWNLTGRAPFHSNQPSPPTGHHFAASISVK